VGFALPGTSRPLAAGPYWVVAIDPNYQWAIVTGGAPKVPSAGGCMTGSPGGGMMQVNNVGFWLFSRLPVDPTGTAAMRAEAIRLGLDLAPLVPVAQAGCTYTGV
jgi:lipocalin